MLATNESASDLIQEQRAYFQTGSTRSLRFRIASLQRLKQSIIDSQEAILEAARADLGRPAYECYFEINVISDINHIAKKLESWMKPQRVATSLDQFPASAWIQPEPLGVALIIGPWNYPFQLVMSPLVGCLAAGNCAVLKPSENAPCTSAVVAEIIQRTFEKQHVAVCEGGAAVCRELLTERFDHIFFTGGPVIGRQIMAAAAEHLTPVTLELGGKSPCIVDADVHLEHAARRIAWGKFVNAGQTCIAPDYLLVDRRIKDELLTNIKHCIREFYGEDPSQSPDYARIINKRHFERLSALLGCGDILIGGETNPENRFIAPTVLDGVSWDSPVMQEEIFGPILPVLSYDTIQEVISLLKDRPKPLALYVFSRDRSLQEQVIASTSSGGVCINDTIMQAGISGLPFGGVGDSGMGSYHGRASFDTFTHFKSVLRKSLKIDPKWRYAPYTKARLQQLKRIVTGA